MKVSRKLELKNMREKANNHNLVAALLFGLALLPFSVNAGTLVIQNLTPDSSAVYALTNLDGIQIPGTTNGNLRVGYFTVSDSALIDAWNAGDLSVLDGNFVQFGSSFGMEDFGAGYNGIFQAAPSADSDSFDGQNIYLFASTGSNFTDLAAEYLIYKFDDVFTVEPFAGEEALGTTGTYPGSLLVGGYNNYLFDYGLGGGSLPAFNTVSVVPEPATWMMLAMGLAGLLRWQLVAIRVRAIRVTL